MIIKSKLPNYRWRIYYDADAICIVCTLEIDKFFRWKRIISHELIQPIHNIKSKIKVFDEMFISRLSNKESHLNILKNEQR